MGNIVDFFRHSLVPLYEALSGLKCPLNNLNSAYFREISTYRKLEGVILFQSSIGLIHSIMSFLHQVYKP